MPTINANIGNEVQVDGSNRIGIKLDNTHDDNVLQLKEDGLYLNGDFVGSSEGFADGSYGVMRIGFASGFDRRSGYNASGLVTGGTLEAFLIRTARYAVIVFVITGIYPKIFPLFEKVGKKEMDQ